MTEIERLANQLRRALAGDPWHGPSLHEILDGITEEQALARPIAGAHTICELVHHITAWKQAVADWLNGSTREVSPEENFPPNANWQAALAGLQKAQASLLTAVATLDAKRLDERLSTREYSTYFALHGVAQHDAYHAGQIQILKRAIQADSTARGAPFFPPREALQ